MFARGRFGFIAVAVVFAVGGHAQPVHLSLQDAIARALQAGTQAELARSAEETARIAQREGFNSLLPQATTQFSRYNQSINLATFGFNPPGVPPVVGPFNVTDAQIAAQVQVFNFAALKRMQALNYGVRASTSATQTAENDVAAAVAHLYVLVQRADAQASSRQADVTLFEQLAKVASDEFAAGTSTRLDVAQANVQVTRARQALLIADNDRVNASLALLNAIGADVGTEIILDQQLPSGETVPSLEGALSEAERMRPELMEADQTVKEAQLNVSAARARRYPSVGLDFVGDMSGNSNNDLKWTRRIAGVVSLPLFRADIESYIARADLALHDAEIRRAQRHRDVEQDVRRSLMAMTNANARVALATENNHVAEEALTVARERRSAGYGSTVEVDRAQDTYRQAHEDLIAAEADLAAAEMDVEHATGAIHARVPQVTPGATTGGSSPQMPKSPSGVTMSTPVGPPPVTLPTTTQPAPQVTAPGTPQPTAPQPQPPAPAPAPVPVPQPPPPPAPMNPPNVPPPTPPPGNAP
jgi:outer membrane protein TolC